MKTYIEWIVRYRFAVIILTLMVTALAIFEARSIKIIIDPSTMMPPSHPYVSASTQVEKVFGSKHVVVIGIHPKQGDIYQSAVLAKVERMTNAFLQVPGVVKENMMSLSAKRAKDISGNEDGLQVHALMPSVPSTPAQMAALREAVERNPVFRNSIVSKDGRTAAIIIEFKEEPTGFRTIMNKVDPIVDRERDAAVEIQVGGLPNFLARLETFSERMGIFLPISVLILCLVLFEAFRTKQGLFLPLVTAALAVAWGVGVMGASGIPMDVFNATTPILILAVATGHAVQLLKRYYEEYERLRANGAMAPRDANRAAVISSVVKVGPVMIAAGTVASLGFFSLTVFEISTVRTFGIFTGLGILAALILEMTFIPALRSVLKPPPDRPRKAAKTRIWGRITGRIATWVTGAQRARVYGGMVLFLLLAVAGMTRVVDDNSVKHFFSADQDFQRDDQVLNEALGGTNTLFVLVEGQHKDAIKDPRT
ncbi:MAG: efflux RND transporter permease subunit, partial [Massilia sp.]